ncbi:MAG TPA: DUF2269 domain-containing protein [Xanthobacteraceae bacterium]|jgi:uncharacterized membrane protein
MIDLFVWLKLIHVLGACVLFGTGLGIAFFMWMAHRTGDPGTIASTARVVVIADAVFTAGAVLLQPLSGVALAHITGYSLLEPWIVASFGLYLLVGACWLPVVWIQLRLRDLAQAARDSGTPLPAQYRRLFRIWFLLGWPAFAGVIAIFALMIAKPSI